MLSQRWRQALGPNAHGPMWRVANVVLFVLALVAAVAMLVGVTLGISLLAARGS
jgi:hypothetical protein